MVPGLLSACPAVGFSALLLMLEVPPCADMCLAITSNGQQATNAQDKIDSLDFAIRLLMAHMRQVKVNSETCLDHEPARGDEVRPCPREAAAASCLC